MNLRRVGLAALATCFAVSSTASGAPKPQIEDKSGDANPQVQLVTLVPALKLTPVPSQAYADVVSVLWENVKIKGKQNIRVTMTLSAPPGSGGGRIQVYRTYGTPAKCASGATAPLIGFAYYTGKVTHAPQSAVRENCTHEDGEITLHEIPAAVIKGNTITWTVETSKFPKGLVKKGDSLKDLYAFTAEIADFRGVCIPAGVVFATETCGLAPVSFDEATSKNSFKAS